ncbi:uncharacterized protein B0P05DRAFT_535810 [Gilbertella persicaria]|uniref:DUF1264 domain protein n=1 Tax=Rhizopus stolonifer TaxID=4846 RepID=A0A367J6W4_RHIST|nr:uncharacterized protein B0P05DRAFT_535810 [Gilbertella persicaria]KAI8084002.1 hypothetical protein B0P05DRAFT_535810 [Gilbertella persicaria]RCH85650.1 hypothetical protein CU098_007015 [Rhizopus stolonifer]
MSTTEMMSKAASVLQSFKPLSNVCESFCGIHPYCDDLKRQIVSYHYCAMIDDERRQCLIYDDDGPNAKLIAVEYIISENLFKSLPEEEKKYWHSHKYEVESGMLVMTAKPMVPDVLVSAAEKEQLQIVANCYGKTWQLWPVDKDNKCSSKIPYGPPQLLMAFTKDNQVDPKLIKERDEHLGISTEQKRKEREGVIVGNPPLPGADHWEHTKPFQIKE